MNEYSLSVEQIVSWFRSKESSLRDVGITLAEVRPITYTHKPSVVADFDTSGRIGRIVIWVSGEIDFEVLARENGKNVFLRHEIVPNLGVPSLKNAYLDFLGNMTHFDSTENSQAARME